MEMHEALNGTQHTGDKPHSLPSEKNAIEKLSARMDDGNARRVGTLTQDEVCRRVRRAVRGFEPPKAASRQLWRRNANLWHQQHTHDQFVAPPPREVEQQEGGAS